MNDRPPSGPCCPGRRPRSVSDYIDRGLRRLRNPMLPVVGAAREDPGGRQARFSLRVADGVIVEVGFQTTTCMTLVAFCEVAAERVTGRSLGEAARAIHPAELARELPRVPDAKRDRALLASQALMATLIECATEGQE